MKKGFCLALALFVSSSFAGFNRDTCLNSRQGNLGDGKYDSLLATLDKKKPEKKKKGPSGKGTPGSR